ncbi:hypothetical protein HN51_039991, partial [Arachis hypogaea]
MTTPLTAASIRDREFLLPVRVPSAGVDCGACCRVRVRKWKRKLGQLWVRVRKWKRKWMGW